MKIEKDEEEHENTGLYHEMNEKDKIEENNDTNLNGDIIKNEIEINEAYPKKFSNIEDKININQISTKAKTKTTKAKIRKDNLIKEAIKAPMKKFIKVLKHKYKIELNSPNWDQILGDNTAQRRRMLKLKIYQFLCFNIDNKKKIISLLKKNEIPFPLMFYLTRTFEEIFTKYVNEDKIFVIKNSTTIINLSLPTLSQVIEEKKEEWRENDTYTNEKVSLFEEISKKLIDDINNGKNERIQKKEKIFIIACELKELEEKMKNYE